MHAYQLPLTLLVLLHAVYVQVVGKATGAPKQQFVDDMVSIISRQCQTEVQQDNIAVQVSTQWPLHCMDLCAFPRNACDGNNYS